MEDFASLFGTKGSGKDLIDKFTDLLERHSEHKLSPGILLGLMGFYSLLGIVSIAKEEIIHSSKNIQQEAAPKETDQAGGSLMDTLSALAGQNSNSASSSGQPDLMGMLSGLASKKKLNPGLLLPLLSLINTQGGNSSSSTAAGSSKQSAPSEAKAEPDSEAAPAPSPPAPPSATQAQPAAGDEKAEKKSHDRAAADLKFERKR